MRIIHSKYYFNVYKQTLQCPYLRECKCSPITIWKQIYRWSSCVCNLISNYYAKIYLLRDTLLDHFFLHIIYEEYFIKLCIFAGEKLIKAEKQ